MSDKDMRALGTALRERRRRTGMTQEELAERAGVSVRTVRAIERGDRQRPLRASLRQLNEALRTTRPNLDLPHVDILGPLTVRRGDDAIEIGSANQRCLLGLLALHVGQPMSRDEIIDVLWDGTPPATHRTLLHTTVSRLRKTLGAGQEGAIASHHHGYVLEIDRQRLDLARFTDLDAAARRAVAPDETRELLDRALDCWQGPILTDLPVRLQQHPTAIAMSQQRLAAVLTYADLAMDGGAHERAAARVRALVHDEPFHEGLHARLMLALAGAGQQAAALALFARIRDRLRTELAVEPGAELRAAHLKVLRGAAPPPPVDVRVDRHVPRQLPVSPQLFTGRTRELAMLSQAHDASTVVVSAIDGMAGIGKTALAVYVAHRIADRYPDGQLFIDLHGHTPGMTPREPAEALDHLLRALGVPGARIPAGLDERAALYRTRLADRKMLVLLDNAATEAQVTPLLPGAPGCLVMVTSRRRLAGLDHSRILSLDTLPVPDAVSLFVRTAGEDRLHDQPPGLVVELVELCGRLPLAIRIAAARLASHPAWNLSHLVEPLRDQNRRLGELTAGHRSVTAALDLSYQQLKPEQQHTYRLLGTHPGHDFDDYATAALLGSTPSYARRIIDQLLDAHLLLEPAVNRYRFHDLTRAHAAHTGAGDRAEPALHRLLDYYRHTAALAMDTAYPNERESRPQVPPAGTAGPDLSDPAHALAWLDSELPNMLAAARHATDHNRPEHVLHLSSILRRHLHSRYHDAETLHHHQVLAVAHITGTCRDEVDALASLSHLREGWPEQAIDHYRRILDRAREIGDRNSQFEYQQGLGRLARDTGNPNAAIAHHRQALTIATELGHPVAQARAHDGLAHAHHALNQHEQARGNWRQALSILTSLGVNHTDEEETTVAAIRAHLDATG